MRKYKAIVSVFLLCIFGVLLLHSAIPHFHNAYNEHHTADDHIHYFEHEGHIHQHVHEHEKNWLDILLGLFEDTNHSAMEDGDIEYFIPQNANRIAQNNQNVKQDLNATKFVLADISIEEIELGPVLNHPPIPPDQYIYCSDALRGPPSKS